MRLISILLAVVLPVLTLNRCMADDLFRDQVAPILAAHCLRCHNPSDAKGGFSLEASDTFFDHGVIKPRDSTASQLIELVSSSINGQPPAMPKNAPPLSDEEREVIKKWIDEGAKWPKGFLIQEDLVDPFNWWSLRPAKRPSVPEFGDERDRAWLKTPIDAFVLKRLREEELSPSGVADRRTLIRRLSYDLTGLPPTIEEVSQFEKDSDPDAYENLVDRLLASPRYGERWAQHWLDVVKYADTCGYDKDKLRPNAWPYRDYVIRSFNNDKAYKQFVEEQIAGDILYPDSPDGILGLGFIAAGPWDFIGHVEVPETKIDGQVARNLDRDEIVSNTINTFCSVTIQCARCHDHKFDPFTQRHYYGLQAVFAALDRAERIYDQDPDLVKRQNELKKKIGAFDSKRQKLTAKIRERCGASLIKIDQAIAKAGKESKPPEFGYHSQIASSADIEKWVEVELSETKRVEQIVLRPCHDEFAGIGPGFGFPVRFRVEVDERIVFDRSGTDFANPGIRPITVELGKDAKRFRVVATKLRQRSNDFNFALAELQLIDAAGTNVAVGAQVRALDSIEAPNRWRKTNLVDGKWFESSVDGASLAELQRQRESLIASKVGKKTFDQYESLKQKIRVARRELKELPPGKVVYAGATHFPAQGQFKPTEGRPRDVRILHRGNVQTPGPIVLPGVLPLNKDDDWEFRLTENTGEGERRAKLAIWLTRDDHPLLWRSIVNRVWHHHFGRGLVDTPNDFGRMGGQPTHPELFDWLTVEFREGGGSFKKLHRLIVTSSVYRQRSSGSSVSELAAQTKAFEADKENRLLWKMNRRRLSAEEIRDSILLASGKLDLKMGGPGYYLFDLEKTEHSPHFEYHKFDHSNPESYRRSIYRFVVRSQPDPYMTTLDCADSSQSTPARNETQTPLQSLTMLNSRFNLAMAQEFAKRIVDSNEEVSEQIKSAFRIALVRDPTAAEMELMRAYVSKHSMANLGRVIFNMSEFVYVD